ncbi:hypothetical protein [Erythrobacter sp. R86502]|uniref:hypothetical protein n=1 Tax=Erythrobacter sp. R86502 TaxID=3093846 RepID=UPI0036D33EDA
MEKQNTSVSESQLKPLDLPQRSQDEHKDSPEIKKSYPEDSPITKPAVKPQDEIEQPQLLNNAPPVSEAIKEEFDRPPTEPGEVWVPLSSLQDWEYHCAVMSRRSDVADAGLLATAHNPDMMRPLVVIKLGDDLYAVKDGRRRVNALRTVHHNKMDTKVRCVIFVGTELQAVESMCDAVVGKVAKTQIEMAFAVNNVHRVSGMSQKAIAERYPALKKDQVSRMIKAARTIEDFPVVFDLLKEPDRVSIDACVRIHDHMKKVSDEEVGAFVSRAEDLAAEGVSFTPGELLDAFDIEGSAKKSQCRKGRSVRADR